MPYNVQLNSASGNRPTTAFSRPEPVKTAAEGVGAFGDLLRDRANHFAS